MGIISGKLFAGLVAGSLTLSAGTYLGVNHMDNIKENIDRMEDAYNLLHDEAFSKVRSANGVIGEKNTEIQRLVDEVGRLEAQLGTANAEITKGDAELTKANDQITKANEDMENLEEVSDAAADRVEATKLNITVEDGSYKVNGKALTFAPVQSQDEADERTVKLFNNNSADIDNVKVVSTNGTLLFEGTLAGGDYKTFKKNNSGEMLKLFVNGALVSTK